MKLDFLYYDIEKLNLLQNFYHNRENIEDNDYKKCG